MTAEEDGACPGCGFPLDESTDEDYPYVYEPHKVDCIPCAEKQDWVKEQWGKDGPPAGTYVQMIEGRHIGRPETTE